MLENKLEKQKQKLQSLIEEMTNDLPPMLMSLWVVNRSQIYRLVDNITADQMDAIITKAREIVDMMECKDE